MERQCLVLLDANLGRSVEIHRVACECGALVRSCERADEVRELRGVEGAGVAIVGIDSATTSRSSPYDAIRDLKAAGFTVIGCLDGVSSQPLGQQCRAFLAGCTHLLDSAREDFAVALGAALRHRLQEVADRVNESRTLRAAMSAQGIVGDSKTMLSVFTSVTRIARLSCFPVLISGESGTGKELVANSIHRLDPLRSRGPFVAVNCGAIARELAESELFGHRRGAFTGAERDRKGLFRSAEGGVLFLDEVAELNVHLQAKLLRVIQEQRVLGVGEDLETPVNVRVVAATNADLRCSARAGTFRADLFNRLNALTIHLPPLRERREDIRPLAEHFISQVFNPCAAARPRRERRIPRRAQPPRAQGQRAPARKPGPLDLAEQDRRRAPGLRDLPAVAWEQLCSERLAAPTPAPQALQGRTKRARIAAGSNRWNMSRALAACERLISERGARP